MSLRTHVAVTAYIKLLIISGALLVLLVWGVIETTRRTMLAHAFEPAMATYLAMTPSETIDPPRLAGRKVVALWVNEKEFDVVEHKLDAAQRASTPAEVAAVVRITRHDRVVGRYSESAMAHKMWADVVVIERSSHRLIASKTFIGTDPPERSEDGKTCWGSMPVLEIVDWLKRI